jgi:LPS export ABC transporter protein LptC
MSKMNNRTNIAILIVIFIILAAGCSDKTELRSSSDTDSTAISVVRPDQIIKNAHIFLYDGSVRTTDLKADSIEKYTDQDSTLAWNLKVNFFDTTGKEISQLVADSGLVREQSKFMEVYGHVVVETVDSVILMTEKLTYDVAVDSIKTEEFVKIVQHGDTIQGYGLEADQRLTRTRIKRQTSGVIRNTEDILE